MQRFSPECDDAGAVPDVLAAHPDWPWPPSSHDLALERDIAHLLERIHAEKSELRRHALWRLYAAKVRMRSDAQIRRLALAALTESRGAS